MRGRRVVVVGGGIAGLATALRVQKGMQDLEIRGSVVVLEAGNRLGGNICTHEIDGFTVECGPNGFLDSVPATLDLVRDVGLEDRLVKASPEAAERYIWRGGRLHRVPSGPLGLLTGGLLSPAGRLRVLGEPFQPRGNVDADESVRAFAARRIGPEAADVLVDAMVSGVFAGDARRLSLPAAFPRMREMEARHGSLVRAMIARRRGRARSGGGPGGPAGTLTTFRDGMAALPRALGERLDGAVRLNEAVRGLRRDSVTGEWTVVTSRHDEITADHVVLALPARMAAPIAETVSTGLASALRGFRAAPLAVVALGYEADDLAGAPDGFGFLAPRGEGLRMLGCLRDSTIFPGRAPDGRVLLRVMIGGAHDPEAADLADEDLLEIVRRELALTLGVEAEPVMSRIYHHPLGIAQYELGHLTRVTQVRMLLEALPGLSVTGSSYGGVSMNACIEAAYREATEIVEALAALPPVAGITPLRVPA